MSVSRSRAKAQERRSVRYHLAFVSSQDSPSFHGALERIARMGKRYSPATWGRSGVVWGQVERWSDGKSLGPAIAFPLPNGGFHGYRYRELDKARRWLFTDGGQVELLGNPEAHERVILCEGEWDVLKLWDMGFPESCTGTGGCGTLKPEWLPRFRGKWVVIVYDMNDIPIKVGPNTVRPGEYYAERHAAKLTKVARQVKVVRLPLTTQGGDVSDFFHLGHTAADLEALIATTPPWRQLSRQDWGRTRPLRLRRQAEETAHRLLAKRIGRVLG